MQDFCLGIVAIGVWGLAPSGVQERNNGGSPLKQNDFLKQFLLKICAIFITTNALRE